MLRISSLFVVLVVNHGFETYNNLTDVCGIANVPMVRIVGGMPAKKDAWPWMVAIFVPDSYGKLAGHVSCGGALISNEHVLTSAHCVCVPNTTQKRLPKTFVLRLGELDISSDDDGAQPVEAAVSEIEIHPNYDAQTVYYDLAVLRLSEPLAYSVSVRPICLPNNLLKSEDLVGLTPFVAGWGKTSENGSYSSILRQVQVEIFSNDHCNSDYSQYQDAPLTDSQLCAGSDQGGKSSCSGDSGSPLMLVKESRWTIVGAMSSGTCGAPGLPDVYASVVTAADWITGYTGITV